MLSSIGKQSGESVATGHSSCPDNAIGLVAQYELSGYGKLG